MKARPLPERSRSSPAPDLRNHGARLNKVKLVRQPSLSADQAKTGLATEWLGAESNRRHVDFQSTALPTELPSRWLCRSSGQPRTSGPVTKAENVQPPTPNVQFREVSRRARVRAGLALSSPTLKFS